MSKPNGGPAFPVDVLYEQDGQKHRLVADGLSMRDYFAAQAMQSFIVRGVAGKDQLASISYAMADLMLLERAK